MTLPPPRRRRLLRQAAAAVALAGLLAGCTGGGDDQDQPAAPGGRKEAPLAVVRGDVPGLVLSAGSLKREDGGVTLRFTVTNNFKDSTTVGDLFGTPGGSPTFDTAGVYLYDGAARKRYDPARDGEACRCSKVQLGLDSGKSIELFATFGDLPQTTGELSAVVPHFAPLDGLKIQG
jgi:hypothetical protein